MKTFPGIVQLAYSALTYPNSIRMEMGYFPGSLIYPTEADIVKSIRQRNQLVLA